MATKNASTTSKAASDIKYPANLNVQGLLSFPLWSNKDKDERLPKWREEKGYKKGEYEDRLGGTLFLTQKMLDHFKKYAIETFLPFAVELNKSNPKKGFTPEQAEELESLINAEDWSESNLPIKDLNEKDVENNEEDIFAKFVFYASGDNDIAKRVVGRNSEGTLIALDWDDLEDEGIPDRDTLWWGSRNTFRGGFNLNAYTRKVGKFTVPGITAYTRSLHLRSDLPMNWGGGSEDVEAVLEEDFED